MNTNIHRLIGPSIFQDFSSQEARLLNRSKGAPKSHRDNIAEGLIAQNAAADAKTTVSEGMKSINARTDLAVQEIQTVPPSMSARFGRYLGKGAASLVNVGVFSAGEKSVDAKVNEITAQRIEAATNQLQNTADAATIALREKQKNAERSVGFLETKATVIAELKAKCKERKDELDKLRKAAGTNKGVLTEQIANLGKAMTDLGTIDSTNKTALSKMETAVLISDATNADQYFQKLFGSYLPDAVSKLDGMLMDYIQGNKADLEQAMRDAAISMYPDSSAKQKTQYEAMKRVAEVFGGREKAGGLRWFGRRLRDTVPGVALGGITFPLGGALLGIGTGGVGVGAGLVARWALNKYKLGSTNIDQWEKAQLESYFAKKGQESIDAQSRMLSAKSVGERLKLLAELKPGAAFDVSLGGKATRLKVTSATEKQVFVTDENGNRHSFDLVGENGDHVFSTVRKAGNSNMVTHKKIAVSDNTLFAMAA